MNVRDQHFHHVIEQVNMPEEWGRKRMAYLIALLIISVIMTMISKMISPAVFSRDLQQIYSPQ
jgi:hypothetical protein